jgi:hypothetical protein
MKTNSDGSTNVWFGNDALSMNGKGPIATAEEFPDVNWFYFTIPSGTSTSNPFNVPVRMLHRNTATCTGIKFSFIIPSGTSSTPWSTWTADWVATNGTAPAVKYFSSSDPIPWTTWSRVPKIGSTLNVLRSTYTFQPPLPTTLPNQLIAGYRYVYYDETLLATGTSS